MCLAAITLCVAFQRVFIVVVVVVYFVIDSFRKLLDTPSLDTNHIDLRRTFSLRF